MFWKNRINRLLSYDASLDVVKLTGGWFTPTWNRQSGPFSENNSEGLASANKDGQWGYVDRARSVVIPFQFKYAGQFDQGMANLIPPK
jgi:hypothetical protein